MEPSTDLAARFDASLATLPDFLERQRWFASKGTGRAAVRALDVAPLGSAALAALIARGDNGSERYFVPLAAVAATSARELADQAVLTSDAATALIDGAADDDAVRTLLGWIADGVDVPARAGGRFVGEHTDALRAHASALGGAIRRMRVEQSNTSLVIGDALVLKLYRRVHAGAQPELEIGRFLTRVGFTSAPLLLGSIEYVANDGARTACAVAQTFVRSDGDAWTTMLDELARAFENPSGSADRDILARVEPIAERTAALHRALATPLGDDDFEAEPIASADLAAWVERANASARGAFDALEARLPSLEALTRARARALLERRDDLGARLVHDLDVARLGRKIRYHGDYHLGQVLVAGDDVTIVDFEGEPGRSLEERRAKSSPLRDVAGMLRSFDYVASAAERAIVARTAGLAASDSLDVAQRARAWADRAAERFIASYRTMLGDAATLVPDDAATFTALLDLFLVEKACYELSYELANRPQWVDIPLGGLERIVASSPVGGGGR